MKNNFNRLLLIMFFSMSSILAQEKPDSAKELIKSYSEYFTLNREAVFLHLNKTAVVPGEALWFSAYVFNPKIQSPYLATTNLHVNLYNEAGKLMEAKTLFIENGKGSGFFELSLPGKTREGERKGEFDTENNTQGETGSNLGLNYPPGKYLIKASTKYMDNFQEDLSFSQVFTILGDTTRTSVERKYDLQLLPEGGHLVANVANTVGVKLIGNTGKGVFFTEAKVLNSKKEVVTTFKSNRFGLSKFTYRPAIGENYTVVLTTEHGKTIQEQIPQSEPTGIVITANTLLPNEVVFSLRTSFPTFRNMGNKPLTLSIQKNGMMKAFGFIFSEKELKANIRVPKTELYPGMNIVTVFDSDFNPILERLVFNFDSLYRKRATIDYTRNRGDSIFIGLKSNENLGPHSLSISVLPNGTKAYNPGNSILSGFYIEPYIKGNLEEGGYYFSREIGKRRRAYDLDLLLLTQGWSKYSWQNIFNHPPKEYFKHQQGFTILGTINGVNKEKYDQALLKSNENGLFAMVDLDNTESFKLENMFVLDSSSIGVGLIAKRKGKISKPPIYLQVLPTKKTKSLSTPNFLETPIINGGGKENMSSENQNTIVDIPKNFIKDAVQLETVKLEAELEDEEGNQGYTGFGTDVIEITKNLENSFFYVTDLIRFKGFRVVRTATNVVIYSTRSISISGAIPPLIFLDGMPLYDNFRLLDLRTSDLKSITVNKTGSGYGMRGAGGVIKLVTDKDYYSGGSDVETTSSPILLNGFAPKKEFYAPKYTSYASPAFESFGVIDWFPAFSLGKKGESNIKILNTLQEEIKLFIEGMTTKGALISETLTVEID